MNAEIIGLFPTPVLYGNFYRPFSEEELQTVYDLRSNTDKNVGNETSEERYVLNLPVFKEIKEHLESQLRDFVDEIVSPLGKLNFYITQSWLNYTEPSCFHHLHSHGNSIFSGVLYIQADPESDKIEFSRGDLPFVLDIIPNKYNMINSKTWYLPAATGKFMIFPSQLGHQVPRTESNKLRISLAFNTFAEGEVGDFHALNGLFLKRNEKYA